MDGRPVTSDSKAGDWMDWVSGPAGTEVVAKLADGEERRLKLADYY